MIEDEKFGYEIWNNKEYYSLLYSASNSVEVLEYLTKGKIFDYEIEGNVKQNLFKFWVSMGANINAITSTGGFSSLHLAAQNGHLEVVKFLVKNKADKYAVGFYMLTPLHLAARGGHLKVVKFLVGKKANINVGNINQYTPLHLAAKNGHVEVVKVLLENGADHNVIDEDGKTPLDLAREKLSKNQKNSKLEEVIDLLSKQIEYHSNVSQSESELSRKADSSSEAFLSDSIVVSVQRSGRIR